jgi:hypothetical protein
MANRYGVCSGYLSEKLSLIMAEIDSYTKDELSRALARLSMVAANPRLLEEEFKVKEELRVAKKLLVAATCPEASCRNGMVARKNYGVRLDGVELELCDWCVAKQALLANS